MSRSKVTVDDHVWKKTLRSVKHGTSMQLRVGIFDEDANRKHPDSELSIGEIAWIHEAGSAAAGVPARPFLSTAFNKRGHWSESAITNAAKALLKSTSAFDIEMETLGRRLVVAVVNNIHSNIPPPLAQATIDRKGHNLALIASGVLINAISYRVVRVSKSSDYAEFSVTGEG